MTRIELFNHSADWLGFEAGKTVFREGEPGEFTYVVIEGEVEIAAAGRVLEIAGPGSIVGELALIDRAARCATATVRAAARGVPVDAKRLYGSNPARAARIESPLREGGTPCESMQE